MVHYMEVSAESLAHEIGVRIKQERSTRRWTLDHLAEVAGVSRRMLVKVEQGSVNPSIGTLLRLSDALGIGLPTLVEPPMSRAAKLVRRGEGLVCGAATMEDPVSSSPAHSRPMSLSCGTGPSFQENAMRARHMLLVLANCYTSRPDRSSSRLVTMPTSCALETH